MNMNDSFPQGFLDESGSGVLESNFTLASCAASSLQAANGSVLPPAVDIAARVAHVVYGSIRTVIAILLNVLIILLFCKFSKLRTISFGIAIQIAAADFLLTLAIFPWTLNHIAGRWIWGADVCIVTSFLVLGLAYVRTCLIFVFSFDRFVSVFAPFNYPKYSHHSTIILCVVSWCLTVANSLILIPPLLDCYMFHESTFSCEFSTDCNKNCQSYIVIVMATHFVPAIFIPMGFFLALYLKGRKIRRQEANMLGVNSRNMSQQDWRASKTFLLLLVAIFLVTFPPIILIILSSYFGQVTRIIILEITHGILYLLTITDPIIILRNADVREALGTLIKEVKESYCKIHNNNSRSNDIVEINQVHRDEGVDPVEATAAME